MAGNKQRQSQQQSFFGMPMSWEWNPGKMMRNMWNPDDDRLFPPRVFGIGWDVNGHALLRRLGVIPNGTNKEK